MNQMLKIILALIAIALPLAACTSSGANVPDIPTPQLTELTEGEEIAVITTNFGEIKMRFFPEYAPKAVENFKALAREGYYDGIIFHRVITGFMIQGGDPLGNGTGGESFFGEPFADEFTVSLRHLRGAVSMANSGANTNGSQFFIVQNRNLDKSTAEDFEEYKNTQNKVLGKDTTGKTRYVKEQSPAALMEKYIAEGGTPHLDGKHTVFGQVYEGMDVVDAIAGPRTDANDKPQSDVVMESVRIEAYTK
jgi:peptidyl-prolyl cis-trans isomerase B (cyclophilin B)